MDTLYWLKRVHLAARKALDELLADYGLTASQLEVLKFLWEQEPIEQRILQERIGVSGATLSHLVNELVEHGFVERRVHPDDSRVNQISLTEKGRLLDTELNTVRAAFHNRYTRGFSQAELMLLNHWLEQLSTNLTETD